MDSQRARNGNFVTPTWSNHYIGIADDVASKRSTNSLQILNDIVGKLRLKLVQVWWAFVQNCGSNSTVAEVFLRLEWKRSWTVIYYYYNQLKKLFLTLVPEVCIWKRIFIMCEILILYISIINHSILSLPLF